MRRSLPASLFNDSDSAGLYLSIISSSSVGAVLWWLEHNLPYSSEEMAAISYRLGAANVAAMLEHATRQTTREMLARRDLAESPA